MKETKQGVAEWEQERILEEPCTQYQIKQNNNENKHREEEETMTKSQISSPDAESSDTGTPAILPQVLGTSVAAMAQMDIGAIFAYPGVTLPQLLDGTSDDLVFTTAQAALFGSVIYLGAMVGSFLAGLPMVRLGQRVTLLMALPLSFASWMALTLAPSAWLVLTARMVQGFALSLMASSSNTYVAEIAHSSIRGRLVAGMELSRQVGSLLIFCLGVSSLTWRQVALTTALVNTVLPFVGLLLLPNSPRWLATRNRHEDARRALSFFRGHNYDTDKELEAVSSQLQKSSGKQTNVFQQAKQLREPAILRYVVVMSFVLFFIHFNGTSVLPAYVVIIMNTAQVQMSSYVAAIAVCLTKIAGTFCFGFVIDRINRKPLFTAISLVNAVSMAILGGYFFDQAHGGHFQHLEWLPLLCLTTYAFFSVSPIISLLRTELFPTAVRSTVVPILYTTFFIGAFLALQTYPYIAVGLGPYGAFWMFAGCSLILIVIVLLTIPETRGKTLEQITEMQRNATRSSQ